MLSYYQVGTVNGDVSFSIGFNTNILLEAISKIYQNNDLSIIERSSISNAVKFLESIVEFCEGNHQLHLTGLSGAEAFSLYVSALGSEGTVEDVQKSVIKQIDTLNDLYYGKRIPAERLLNLVKIFNAISERISQDLKESYTKGMVNWRP